MANNRKQQKKHKLKRFDQVDRLFLIDKLILPINSRKKETHWYCLCECGGTKIVRACHLGGALVRSCGCLRRENALRSSSLAKITTTKFSKEEKKTHYYKCWKGIRDRVSARKIETARIYKNRGIKVCPEWSNYYVFKDFCLKSGFKAGLTIDRINNYGDYEPNNVRFVTMEENLKNRRPFSEWTPRKRKAL